MLIIRRRNKGKPLFNLNPSNWRANQDPNRCMNINKRSPSQGDRKLDF
ncbi:hypothetical protein HanXRQr2_Chr04g0191001 [Helianthus annuus]|uniref:Uncharacterized protein n=1 Tax=Helianthus annuus TaxID=4232 RepID=A0A9K3JCC2_HELAN|nr:hypothetical protein HanXRQr2_Chr04g0191001 [Helianthus annuus]KAJ0933410.1 hypothetical protein HanPSC8_Chr04g0184501 [Helianthus annuus]